MFGLGIHPLFLLLLFVIVLMVFGPGKLPEVARAAGRMVREFRKASDDVTGEIRRALDLPEVSGASLFSAQGLMDQLSRVAEPAPATAVEVPLATGGDADLTGTEETAETEEPEPGSVGAAGSYAIPEVDPSVYAASYDGTAVAEDPLQEASSSNGHQPSPAPPPKEPSAVEPEPAAGQALDDPVDATQQPAVEEPAPVEPEPAAQVTDPTQEGQAPAAVEPPASPGETPAHPAVATVDDPHQPEEGGGEKTGEGAD